MLSFRIVPRRLSTALSRAAFILFAILFLSTSLHAADSGPEFSGHWEGAIEIPGMALAVRIDLEGVGESLGGTIDIPAQNAKGLELEGVATEGANIRFSIAGILGAPTFDGTLEGEEIRGKFQQGGQEFPFTLSRGAPEPAQAQAPPPVPYNEEEVGYENGEFRFAGTLTLPRGKGPFPAVLLLTGSGPQDRDETIFGHKPFRVIADHLTRAGIAVLRVDDRGVGGSTGQVMAATLSDFASDALAGVVFLKSRSEIDGERIGLLGHSEGGVVAPLAASRSEDIAFLVLLAAPAVTGEELLYRQNELLLGAIGAGEERIEAQVASLREIFALLRAEGDHQEALREAVERQITGQLAAAGLDVPEDARQAQVDAGLGMYGSPWMRSFLTHDPRPTLSRTRIPILALNGGLDLQVDAEQNLTALRGALEEAGNQDGLVKELEGLNHLFQHAKTGLPTEYGQIDEAIDPIVLDLVGDWILEHFGTRPAR